MATTTNYGWDTPDDTDLVKDGAAAIRTLGSSVDTTTKNLNPQTTTGALAYRSATANVNTALPIGTAGQILAVSGGVPAWINNDQGDITEVQAGTGISVASGTGPIPVVTNTVATAYDAKGDLIVGTGADAFSRLAVGATNGMVLTVDSGEATGLKYAAPAGGGKVLQVVFAEISTFASTTLTSFVNTGLTATITPSSASSKVLVIFTHNGVQKSSGAGGNAVQLRLQRSSSDILKVSDIIGHNGTSSDNPNSSNGAQYLDSPNTTSATTYRTQFASAVSGQTAIVNNNLIAGGNTNSTMVLMEIGA